MKATRQQINGTVANTIKGINKELVAAIKALQEAEVNEMEADYSFQYDRAKKEVVSQLDDIIFYAKCILDEANAVKYCY